MANNNNGPSQGPSTNPNNNSSNTNSSNINTNNASNTSTNNKKPTVPFLKIVPSPDKTALLKYKDDKLVGSMPYLRVVSVVQKIAEEELPEEVKIEYKTKYINGEFRIPLEDMYDVNIIMKYLMKNHVIINPANKYDIQEYLLKQIGLALDTSTYDYEHKIIGWHNFDGNLKFLLDDTDIGNGQISKCIRNMGNFKNGSEAAYDKMLDRYVYTNTAMSLAYTLGFVGVLVSRISHHKDLGVLLVGMSGQSTTGKTTAMKLQASIFADTDDVKGRMIMRNQGSEIGFHAQYKGIHGPCILFDDIDQTTKNAENMGQLIHQMSKGTTRVVANTSGDALFNRGSFSGIVIFTSERSLLDRTSKEMGMMVRFLDLNDLQWTVDGPSAEAIKDCVCKNYGFKGERFGRFMEGLSDDVLLQYFDDACDNIKARIANKDSFFHRILKNLAVIIATAELLNKCFNIFLDVDGMIDLIIAVYENGAEERNRPLEAYKAIFEYFKKNYTKFNFLAGDYVDYPRMSKDRSPLGFVRFKKTGTHIGISVRDCDKILNELGFTQLPNYVKYWKDNNLILTAKGRTTCSSTTSLYARHYHFVYPKASEDLLSIMSPYFEDIKRDEQIEELNQVGLGVEPEEPVEQTIKETIETKDLEMTFDDSAAIADIFKEEE